jgi:uncharacterized membrane protein
MNPTQREGRRPFAPRFAANFAPISSGPSTRRSAVISLFFLNAVLCLIFAFAHFANLFVNFLELPHPLWMKLTNVALLGAISIFSVFVGTDLRLGRRRALTFGIPFLSLGVIAAVWRPHPSRLDILLSVALLVALVSLKDELTVETGA